jgi:DNA-binding GntR family transcriptional regulator
MGMVSEPIVTTSLADEIAFRLETAILDGLYPPGSRVPQEELCERFAVSRTPVREALRKLQAKNLVVVVPNKGATVRLLSRKELLDIYDVRAELEGFSCELAAALVPYRDSPDGRECPAPPGHQGPGRQVPEGLHLPCAAGLTRSARSQHR